MATRKVALVYPFLSVIRLTFPSMPFVKKRLLAAFDDFASTMVKGALEHRMQFLVVLVQLVFPGISLDTAVAIFKRAKVRVTL